jgi:hypothetical protein
LPDAGRQRNPDTCSLHLVAEHVDIAVHRFVLEGRVIVVGVVNRNQISRHDFSCNGLLLWVGQQQPCALDHSSFRPFILIDLIDDVERKNRQP